MANHFFRKIIAKLAGWRKVLNTWQFKSATFIIIIAILVVKIHSYGSDLEQVAGVIRPAKILLAFPIILTTLFFHVAVWKSILKRLGQSPSFADTLYVYFYSSLARYIPGSYWYIVSRSALGFQNGYSALPIVLASGIEIIVNVAVSAALAAFGLYLGFFTDPSIFTWLFLWVGIGAAAFILMRVIRPKSDSQDGQMSKIKMAADTLVHTPILTLTGWIAGYLMSALCQGLALCQILSAWSAAGQPDYLLTTISYATSWLIGFINPLTPNGLGSREAILVVSLINISPATVTLAASLVIRLSVILGESLWAALGWFLRKKSSPVA